MKLLLCRGSPRQNIQEVEELNPILPCDKLICTFTPEFQAYKKMRDYFLSKDYDYMVLATDDIVVRPEHVIQLESDLIKNNYQVLSGLMNVDECDWNNPKGNINICTELALKDKKLRNYYWFTYDSLPQQDIFQVKFSGFPLMVVRRDIIEKYEFAGDAIFKGKGMEFGASLDFVFCWFCHENNIPIFVDKRISMQHLRNHGKMRIGESSPKLWFWPQGKEIERIPNNFSFNSDVLV